MLNADALKQLSQLKTEIRSSKEFAEGRVRGSNGKFGFVVLEDGREAFLPPAEMERVFPGDRVRISLNDEGKGKITAELDSLLESELKRLVGQYIQRGQGHFVQPSEPGFNRWIFLPPKNRSSAKSGDLVVCTINRHPFKDGKPQARVETVIGPADAPGIEHAFVVAQFQLPNQFSPAVLAQVEEIQQQVEALCAERKDLSDIGFATIDAETTRDMDDALAVTARENGWTLHIAIADPTSLIQPNSPLDKEAQTRVNSLYLLGGTLPMLPKDLCENTFSLLPGKLRPALVMHIEINSDGSIGASEYEFAAIRSQHKLSYEQVSGFIQAKEIENKDEDAVPESQRESLRNLAQLSEARASYRAGHSLIMEDRPDYEIVLNEARKIARIEKQQRNIAQRMVEEAMLAANICAGEKLAELGQGCFSIHLGFRDERMGEVKSLLTEMLPPEIQEKFAEKDLHQLDNYLELVKYLESHQEPQMQNLLAVLKRMLRPGQLSNAAAPHLGLGLSSYATITSPIRKYNDLHNHRVLRAAIAQEQQPALPNETVESMQQALVAGRQANRALEQWLYCQYLQDKIGQSCSGKIALVNGAGIGVRLDENGIDGFVRLNGKKTPLEFDGKRLTLKHGENTYQLEQTVNVKIAAVDIEKRRIAFELVNTAE